MTTAYAPPLIQDADDGPGLLTERNDGQVMTWDANRKRFAMATLPAVGAQQIHVARSGGWSVQQATDGPGALAAGDDGKALVWNQATGRFIMATVSGGDADTLDGLDSTAFLLATGARTGATSQAQTFTNGIVGPTWKPAADSITALQLQTSGGTAVVTVDTTNQTAIFAGKQSTGTLGSELVTDGGFATDLSAWTATNWTWVSGKARHTTGNTSALSQTIAGIVSGTVYRIVFTISSRVAGSVTISLGAATYATTQSTNATHTIALTAAASGSLTFSITPTTDFDGDIDDVSVMAITASIAVQQWKDDAGSVFNEVRGKASLTNIGVGLSALRTNVTGSGNVAIGANALLRNFSGTNNFAIGSSAMQSNTTGISNVAIGSNALLFNTVGNFNVGIGASALQANTAGGSNTGIGLSVMAANTTGSNNTAIGVTALTTNTTGGSNTAIGVNALNLNLSGNFNTAVGRTALNNCSTGSSNVALGYQAGFSETGSNKLYIANTSTATPLIYGDFSTGLLTFHTVDAGTTTIVNTVSLAHQSSGTPGVAFGTALRALLESSTTADQDAGRLIWKWNVATHASREAQGELTAYYTTTERTCIAWRANSTVPMIGFYGTAPVAQPAAFTQTYSTADRTLGAYTPDSESGAYTGIDNLQAGTPYAQLTDLNALRVAYENVRAFVEDIAQMLNALVDDHQALGLAG